VYVASPAQFAGVQAGYIIIATALSSSTVAAAVVAGRDVGVAASEGVDAAVGLPFVPSVGAAGDPHETAISNVASTTPRAHCTCNLIEKAGRCA
jgi:hypothetical protein